jgi:sterol desaturase/sphingolipid hydroxylase (fatty acid hydroxylase superfamily)
MAPNLPVDNMSADQDLCTLWLQHQGGQAPSKYCRGPATFLPMASFSFPLVNPLMGVVVSVGLVSLTGVTQAEAALMAMACVAALAVSSAVGLCISEIVLFLFIDILYPFVCLSCITACYIHHSNKINKISFI